jgi:hypothetical protein
MSLAGTAMARTLSTAGVQKNEEQRFVYRTYIIKEFEQQVFEKLVSIAGRKRANAIALRGD